MRRVDLPLFIVALSTILGCGGNFELPTERRSAAVVPDDKSYAMLATWKGLAGIRDVMITRGTGSQLFMLFNTGGSGGPATPRGEVRLYPFTQPVSIGSPFFDTPRTLFNPVAIASAQNLLFVLDQGDSCLAKFDPQRGTCEADPTRNGRQSIIHDYAATWRVREYPITGGDTVSTFTDTTVAQVNGIGADDAGHVYVSGIAVVLDTSTTDQRIRTRKFISRIYRYARGPRYPGVVLDSVYGPNVMPGANWHRDTTWVVLDGTGRSSVVDPRGIKWTPTGTAGGAVFVADRGNNKAKLIATNAIGVGVTTVDGSETPTGTSFNGPQNVAVDESGFLYIVDRLNRRVLRYDTYGGYIQEVNVEKNSDDLPLLDPIAIGVDDSLAYVADFGRGQVIRFKRRK
jgi:hypothetical protein